MLHRAALAPSRRQGASRRQPYAPRCGPTWEKSRVARGAPSGAWPNDSRSRHPQGEQRLTLWVRAGSASLEPPLNHDSDSPLLRSSSPPLTQPPTQAQKPKRKAGAAQAAVGVRPLAEPSPEPPPDSARQAGHLVMGARSGSLSCLDTVTGEQRWSTHAHDG